MKAMLLTSPGVCKEQIYYYFGTIEASLIYSQVLKHQLSREMDRKKSWKLLVVNLSELRTP